MKKITLATFVLLIVATLFTNCFELDKKKEDNTAITALLLYVNDQLGGNCAMVMKSGTTYTASLFSIPKGGCSKPSTKEEAIALNQSNKEKTTAIFTKAGSNCNAALTAYTNTINNNITTLQNQTEAQYTASVANTKYIVIGNLVTESALTMKNELGYTEAQIASTNPGTLQDYYITAAILVSGASQACQNEVKLQGSPGLQTTPASVLSYSVCAYGPTAAATRKCATLSDQY
ncbi:hypothetical protein LEP1GSC195_2349 [Leptospira wolbachii serovar Codice str. CDC]|uniref:Uncharacterized protein n=1 Tax=Leptospira wolbachii serovar Codice str. CDC TaxID=1218599 RepID=R9A3G7_9LEPT|nr:hypothetical protein [Leptospira wolbachii]EOQ96753.1 hypothetical protein LEP1GSC195_2349 [Leptospira wolbachii serovar Codice str. CDC]